MYCFCFRFNQLLSTQSIEGFLSQQKLQEMIKKGDIFVSQKAFCLLFSTNSFFKMQGQFLMKIFQAYSLSIQKSIIEGNYSILFNQNDFMNKTLNPIIKEFLETKIPCNISDKDIVLNLNGFKEYFAQLMHSELVHEASQISFRIPGTKKEIQYETNESFYQCILELLSP